MAGTASATCPRELNLRRPGLQKSVVILEGYTGLAEQCGCCLGPEMALSGPVLSKADDYANLVLSPKLLLFNE